MRSSSGGFALSVLGAQDGERNLLPSHMRDWCHEYAHSTIARLEQGGYAVAGDAGELIPRDDAFVETEPAASHRQVAEAAVRALAELLTDQGRQWLVAREGARGQGTGSTHEPAETQRSAR